MRIAPPDRVSSIAPAQLNRVGRKYFLYRSMIFRSAASFINKIYYFCKRNSKT